MYVSIRRNMPVIHLAASQTFCRYRMWRCLQQHMRYLTRSINHASCIHHLLSRRNRSQFGINSQLFRCLSMLLEDADLLKNLSEDDRKKLHMIRLDYDVQYNNGVSVPETMTDDMWLSLLKECQNENQRKARYEYWYNLEVNIAKGKEDQILRQAAHEARRQERLRLISENKREAIAFNLIGYLQFHKLKAHYESNIMHSALFGPRIVFDMSFCDNMSVNFLKLLNSQFMACHGENRTYRIPFYLMFTNVNTTSPNLERFTRPESVLSSESPYFSTDKCMTDLFPADRIVYLTPDSRETVWRLDADDIYVMGTLPRTDQSGGRAAKYMARAKELGVRTAALPAQRSLRLRNDQVLSMRLTLRLLQDMYVSNTWEPGLDMVPSNKILSSRRRMSLLQKLRLEEAEKSARKQGALNPCQREEKITKLVSELSKSPKLSKSVYGGDHLQSKRKVVGRDKKWWAG